MVKKTIKKLKWIHDAINCRIVTEDDENVMYTERIGESTAALIVKEHNSLLDLQLENYAIFLIYCIARDVNGYWESLEYDIAYEMAAKKYKDFKKVDNGKGDLYKKLVEFLSEKKNIKINKISKN